MIQNEQLGIPNEPYTFSADRMVDTLRSAVENHMDVAPEEVNWGHVGSAKHLLQLIKEASEFAGIESAE